MGLCYVYICLWQEYINCMVCIKLLTYICFSLFNNILSTIESCPPPSDLTGQCDSILTSPPITRGPLPFSYYDPDGIKNTVITYSIASVSPSNGDDFFNINSSTGVITIAQDLDVDVTKIFEYNITVRLTDQGGFSVQFPISITLDDVNDSPPIPGNATYTANVPEGLPIGSSVPGLSIVFEDGDSGINSRLTYSIQPSGDFILTDSSSPNVYTNRSFDYETQQRQYTLVMTAVDGGSPSMSGSTTITINIIDINDNRPTIRTTSQPVSYREDGPAVAVADIEISDADSSSFPMYYALVRLMNKVDTEETLDHTGVKPMDLQVDVSDDTILVYGEGSVQEYSDFLSTITYQNPAEEMSSVASGRSISYSISDIPFAVDGFGEGSGALDLATFLSSYDSNNVSSVIVPLLLEPVNDQPVLACTHTISLPSISEDILDSANTGFMVNSSGILSLISDNDGPYCDIAIIGISGDGSWQWSSGSTFIDIINPSISSAILFGPDTILRFVPNSHSHGSASFSFRAWDRSDGHNIGMSGVDTRDALLLTNSSFSRDTCVAALEIIPVNDPPVLDLDMGGPDSPNYTASYTENQSPSYVYIADMMDITIVDVDHIFIQSLTVKISKTDGSCDLPSYPYTLSEDHLAPANSSILDISVSVTTQDKACRTYTFTGNHTIGNWEWYIGSLQLSINNTEPSDHTRRLELIINDGTATSSPVYSFVSVTLVSDNCPIIDLSLSGHLDYIEHGGPISIDNLLNITDGDYKALINSMEVRLTIPNGVGNSDEFDCNTCVLVVDTTGVSSIMSYFDITNDTLIIEGPGTPDEFQQVLRTLTFNDTGSEPSFESMLTLTYVTEDGTSGGCPTAGEVTIVLQPVNDFAPTLRLNGNDVNFTTSYAEDDIEGARLVGQVEVNDPDTVDSLLYNISIEIVSGYVSDEDSLMIMSPLFPSEATLILSSNQRIIIETSLVSLPNALNAIQYINNNTIDPSTQTRVIRFLMTDGGRDSEPAYAPVTVTTTNDAPVVDLNSVNPLTRDNSIEFDVEGPAVAIASTALLSDPDGTQLHSMRLVLQEVDSNGNIVSPRSDTFQESLTFTSVSGITGSYVSSTGILSFTGVSSLNNYQQLLRSISYANTDSTPSLNQRKVQVSVNDGSDSTSATVTISIGDLPTAPVVDLNGGNVAGINNQVSFTTKEQSPITIAPAAIITDMENDFICNISISFTGPSQTCTSSGLTVTSSFSDMTISMATIANGFSYDVSTSFSLCRQSIAFDNILRTMTFEAPDSAPAGTCTVVVRATDYRGSTSLPATITISVAVGNEPPSIDLDLGRVGRHFSFEYIQGIDGAQHIVSIYDESLARNLSFLTPVGEAPGEASLSVEQGAQLITNLSHAGYSLTDEDSSELEHLSVKFLYQTVLELQNDAIRFPCISSNDSITIDPIGCTRYRETTVYSNLVCDPNLFNACDSQVDLCSDLVVTVTCTSTKEYRFSYSRLGTVNRYYTLLGYLGYEYINNETVFARFDRTINVTAYDGQATSIGALTQISIVRKDDSPVIAVTDPAFIMYENDRPNRSPNPIYYTIPVQNPDGTTATRGTYTLQIVGGDDVSSIFTMNEDGDIRLIGALDYEEKQSYTIRVSALFNGADPRTATIEPVVIQIVDVNDNPPEVQSSFTAYVYENLNGEFVVRINGTDRDEGSNAVLVYSPLLGIGADMFSVNRTTGVITTARPLNASMTDYYLLVLIVHDMGDVPLCTHTVINVHVEPTPPDSVVFALNSLGDITLSEDTLPGHVIGTVIAYEVGTMDSTNIRYRTIPANNGIITVSPINGTVQLATQLNAEDIPDYTVTIEAYSIRTGLVVMPARVNLTITVSDVDEFAPTFVPPGPYSISLAESTSPGIIYQLTAADSDASAHVFVFSSIGDTGPFNVLSNGSIVLTRHLDFETETHYSFNVTVYDSNGNIAMTVSTTINISVTNINDNPPHFLNTPYNGSVEETAPNGHVILTVAVGDLDQIVSNVTFELLETDTPFNMSGYDLIVSNSTLLTLYESDRTFVLTVRVTEVTSEGTVLTSQTSITIQLILINEFSPAFPPSDINRSTTIREQAGNCSVISGNGARVGDVLHDFNVVDMGGEGSTITYSLYNDGGPFRIDPNDGRLIVDGCVDAEQGVAYNMIIYAADEPDMNGNQFNISTNFIVNLADINDFPPVVHGPFSFTVRENETRGEFKFGYISVSDADASATNSRVVIWQTAVAGGEGGQECSNEVAIGILRSLYGLYFCREIDFDSTTQRVFVVQLVAENFDGFDINGNPFKLSVPFNVTITLVDQNEFRPMITGSNFEFSIGENLPNNTLVGAVPSTDNDASDGRGGMLTYFISTINMVGRDDSCTTDLPFYIDNTGNVYTCKQLNYETGPDYYFYVSVCDRGDVIMCTIQAENVTVNVIDRNDNPPVVPSQDITINLLENDTAAILYTFTWTDLDSADNSNVSLVLNTAGTPFGISGNELIVIDPAAIDYELGTRHFVLNVSVVNRPSDSSVDQTQIVYITITINIIDINDIGPSIHPPFVYSIAENQPENTIVFTVNATDGEEGDNGLLSYTSTSDLISTDCSTTFNLSLTTGVVSTCDVLNYELDTEYNFTIQVCDNGNPQLCMSQLYVINVIDLNDNLPVFPSGILNASLYENLAMDTSVFTISTTDADGAPNSMVTYSLINTSSPFAIRNQNVIYYTGESPVDYESSQKIYMLQLRATNPPSDPDDATQIVDIIILLYVVDRNDLPPMFASDQDTASIAEHMNVGSLVYLLSTTDGDSPPNSEVYYRIITSGTPFSVNNNMIVVSNSQELDREQLPDIYEIKVEAINEPALLDDVTQTANITVNIEILDINDNSPIFNGTRSYSVLENVVPDYIFTQRIRATDADEGLNGMVVFTIENTIPCACGDLSCGVSDIDTGSGSGDPLCMIESPFEIDHDNGELSVCSRLDYEAYCTYTVIIRACDLGNPQLCSMSNVTINLIDVNDNSPVIEGPFNFTVEETVGDDYEVGCIDATDPDTGMGSVLRYYSRNVTECSMSFPFEVDEGTGCIRVCHDLNFEHTTHYRFDLQVRDSGSPVLSSTETIIIYIINVNDHGPMITSPPNASVPENSINALVLTVTAVDIDREPFNDFTFSLTNSAGGRFNMTSDGKVYTAVKLDREAIPSHVITVQVYDGRFTNSQNITVIVLDENDHEPYYIGPLAFTVEENSFFTLSLMFGDNDTGINAQVYIFNTSDGYTSSGLNLSNSDSLDRDPGTGGSPIQTVQVTGRDTGDPPFDSSPVTLTLTVTDVNDNPPIPLGPFNASVRDNTQPGVRVTQLNAIDYDEGQNAELVFTLLSHTDLFYINATSNELYTNAVIELVGTMAQTMSVSIRVADRGSVPLITTYTLNITIVDNLPIFVPKFYNFSIPENTFNTSVGEVTAIDRDLNSGDPDFEYTIVSSSPYGGFTMVGNTIVSPENYLDYEDSTQFTLVVGVGNTEMVVDTATVTIYVNDVNDNMPILSPANVSVNLPENSPAGYVLIQLVAIDYDSELFGTVSYRLLSGDGMELFEIDGDGNLKTAYLNTSDYEQNTHYTLTYQACDNGNPPSCSTPGVISVTVIDADDVPPVFNPKVYTRSISESFATNTPILTVTVTDEDTPLNQLVYTLEPPQSSFSIEQVTGVLSTTDVPLDYEVDTDHSFSIIVTDTGGSSDTATVTITIGDENDNRPTIRSTVSGFVFNEEQVGALSLDALYVHEPDTASRDKMNRVMVSLRSSTKSTSSSSYPYEGGLCDHANYTIVDNTSFGLCHLSECTDVDQLFEPIVGATYSNRIFNFTTGRLRTDALSSTVLQLANNFTISFWIKIDGLNSPSVDGRLFSIESTGVVILRAVVDTSGNILVASGGNINIIRVDSTSIINGEWHHFTLTRSNAMVRLYIDGVLEETSSYGNMIVSENLPRNIFVEFISGYMAQFRFCSNYSLSHSEVLCTISCGEVLHAVNTTNIDVVFDYRARSISFVCNQPNSSCSVDNFDQALNTLTYSNRIDEPHPLARGLFTTASDVLGYGALMIYPISSNLTNDKPPVIDLNGPDAPGINFTFQYEELSDPVAIVTDTVSIYDLDSGYWKFNRIVIELLNPQIGSEFLAFSSGDVPSGIEIVNHTSVSLGLIVRSVGSNEDSFPGRLIEGLRAIKYSNSLKNPTDVMRTISVTIYDSQSVHINSPLSYITVNIILANDPPELTIGSTSVTFDEEDRSLVLFTSTTVQITDPDSTNISRAVFTLHDVVNVGDESLSLDSIPPGITRTYDSNTRVLTISGSAAITTYVSLIKAVVYRNSNLNPTSAQRRVTVLVADDQGRESAIVSVTINIDLHNDPGTLVFGSTGTSTYRTDFIEDTDECIPVFGNNFTLTDPEGRGFAQVGLTLNGRRDGESFTPTGFVGNSQSFAFSFVSGQINIFLNADDDYTEILSLMMYCNSNEEPIAGERMISITISDMAPGVRATTQGFTFINIVSVNDPPVLNLEALPGLVFGDEPVLIFKDNINLTDSDSTTFTGFIATITNPEDTNTDEAVQSLGDLEGRAVFRGPVVLANSSFVFTATYASPVDNVTIVHDIEGLRYNNEAGQNITIDPARIVCVQVVDGDVLSNAQCVSIRLTRANINAPRFLNGSQLFTYSETNSLITVGHFIAMDDDTDPIAARITYSIESTTSFDSSGAMTLTSGIFTIDAMSGLLTAPNGLDAESYVYHNVSIKAEDNGNPRRSTLLYVTFDVLDVNDNAPSFTNLPYTPNAATAREEFVPYTDRRDLYTVSAVDADISDTNNQITYGLVNTYYTPTDSLAIFHIDSSTGVLYYNQRLDAEQEDVFIFNVSATDNGVPSLTSYTIINFIPIDINDNPATVNQLTPTLFVSGQQRQPSSIGPAIRVTDPDDSIVISTVSVQLTDPYSVTDYITCMESGGCQEQRTSTLPSSVNLLSLATYSGDGVSNTTLGACPAKNFTRIPEVINGITNHDRDGYGRISRSALNSTFGSGEFSFSFVASFTNEGHVVGIVNTDDPNASSDDAEIAFSVWFRRNRMALEYTDTNGDFQLAEINLDGNPVIQQIFFPPTGFYITRHYMVIVRSTSSTPRVEFYANCDLVGTVGIAALPAVPGTHDVFIGRTIPGTSSFDNLGRRHFGGDLHGLFYYPYALSDAQRSVMCPCEYLSIPSQYSDLLTVTQNNLYSISISSPSDTAVLPPADVNSVLRRITYTSVLDEAVAGNNRTLTFTSRFGALQTSSTTGHIYYVTSDTEVPFIDLNGPSLVGIDYSTSYTEDGAAVAVVSDTMSITRSNLANVLPTISSVTVELTNSIDGDDEELTGTGSEFISLIVTNRTQVVITGPGLPEEFVQVLKTIRYVNRNQNPTTSIIRTLSFHVTDTEGRSNSPPSITNITVISVGDAPQLSLSAQTGNTIDTVQFIEDQSAINLATNLTITDVDSAIFTSARVSISGNFVPNSDVLSVSSVGGITSDYDSTNGVLTLNGSATLNDYHTVLRSLTFFTSDNPLLDIGSTIEMRSVNILVSDGTFDSNSVTVYVDFIPVDDPTELVINGSSVTTYIEGTQPAHILPYAYITDSDNTIVGRIVIQLVGENGDGLTVGNMTQSILEYSNRAMTDLITILRNITFANTLSETSVNNRTITITLTDIAERTATYRLIIVVKDRNDNTPMFIGTPYQFSILENSANGTSVGTVRATDADTTPTDIVFATNETRFRLIPSDTEMSAEIVSNQVFDFESGNSVITFSVSASDDTHTGIATVMVTINNVNEPPSLSISGTATAAAVQQSRPLLYQDNAVSITDQDNSDTINSATLALSNVPTGSNESLTLNQTLSGYTFTSTVVGSAEVYTLTKTTSTLSVSTALQYIYYTAGDIEDSLVVREVSVVVTDAGGLESNAVIISVTLADEPQFVPPQYTISLYENRTYDDFLQISASVANPNDTIVYSIEPYNGITINSTTGYLSLSIELDYETVQSFDFDVYAVASVPLPRTATTTVYVTVLDVNDASPLILNMTSIDVQIGVADNLLETIVVEDPDTFPLANASIIIEGDQLQPHPFSGSVCVDENNIITKMVTQCGLTDYINLLLYNETGPGASLTIDSYDNTILTTEDSYARIDAPLFTDSVDYFMFGFWFKPVPSTSGYIIFYGDDDSVHYFSVFYDSHANRFKVTLNRNSIEDHVGQVTILFQLEESIEDDRWHFVMINYQTRFISLSVDANRIESVGVVYADILGRAFGKFTNQNVNHLINLGLFPFTIIIITHYSLPFPTSFFPNKITNT